MLPIRKFKISKKTIGRHIFLAIVAFVITLDIFAVRVEAKTFAAKVESAKEQAILNNPDGEKTSTASAIVKAVTTPTEDITLEEQKSSKETLVSMLSKDRKNSEQVQSEEATLEQKAAEAIETLNLESEVAASENSGCKISDAFTPEVKRWEEEICRWSEEHNMDPDLIATIMQIESCGNDKAKSATGVRGLFQVTGANLDGQDPWNPNVSMAKGPGKVLKVELDQAGGDIRAAMAGYNGGGKARDYVAGKISRNQFYYFLVNHSSGLWWTRGKALAKINEVERYAQWSEIYFEAKDGRQDTLQEWWDLGGSRLCSAARRGLAQYIPEE